MTISMFLKRIWKRIENVSKGDIVILVIGPPGCGKSTFINTVTRKDAVQVHHKLSQHNTPITPVRGSPEEGKKGESSVVFVDTPPLDSGKDVEVTLTISKWLEYASNRGAILAGIIYLYPITAQRMTEHPGLQYEKFIGFVRGTVRGGEVPTVLATTMWEKSPPLEEVKTQRHSEITANWRKKVNHGEVMQHNGTYESSQGVVGVIVSGTTSQSA